MVVQHAVKCERPQISAWPSMVNPGHVARNRAADSVRSQACQRVIGLRRPFGYVMCRSAVETCQAPGTRKGTSRHEPGDLGINAYQHRLPSLKAFQQCLLALLRARKRGKITSAISFPWPAISRLSRSCCTPPSAWRTAMGQAPAVRLQFQDREARPNPPDCRTPLSHRWLVMCPPLVSFPRCLRTPAVVASSPPDQSCSMCPPGFPIIASLLTPGPCAAAASVRGEMDATAKRRPNN